MRTVVDSAPGCRGPAHADEGTGCDRFDQEPLAIGTSPTTVKERSRRHESRHPSSSRAKTAQRVSSAEFSW
jgi:hypothetical protein